MQKLVCVDALKLVCVRPWRSNRNKGVKSVEHSEKAVSAEEEHGCQMLMESVGGKSRRLERTSAGFGQWTVEKAWKKMRHPSGENGQ